MPLVIHDNLTPLSIVTFAGKAIDVPGGSKSDGEKVQQYDRNATPAQLWIPFPCGNGDQYLLVNRGSGRVLDVADGALGAPVQQFACALNGNQRFHFEDAGDGLVVITLAGNHDLVLDVEDNSSDNGARIVAWTRNGQANQRFRLVA